MKKFITFVLTAAMAVSALGVTVFAEDAAPTETPVATEPAEGEDADKTEAPAEPEAPAEGEDADKTEAPAEGEDADKTEAPAEADKADENADPAKDAETGKTEAPAEPEAPAETKEPEAKAAPIAAPAAKATAELSNAKVLVNGNAVDFQAYNIEGNNYFKLRDIAIALNETGSNFDIGYDKATRAITLTKGTAYTGAKEADAAATAGKKAATLSNQSVTLDGAAVSLTAYNIDGFNYFKLRDLGDALGFEVAWDKEAKTIAVTAKAVEAPADDKTEAPADDKTEAPAEDKTEAPADDKTEAPADDKTEAPADDKTEAPADDAAKE